MRPRNYLEIGVNDGRSLRLSRVPSVAIDPAFRITEPLRCDLYLVRETSDAFFARRSYEDLVKEFATPDPQQVPAEIIERRGAVDPERFFGSGILELLASRRGRSPRPDNLTDAIARLRAD